MKKKKMTVNDLLLLNSASITLQEAADAMDLGYKTLLRMAKQDKFPVENCLIRLNGDGETGKYVVMRARLVTYITGLSYVEQIRYKKETLQEREKELKDYSEAEKEKIKKIISNISE